MKRRWKIILLLFACLGYVQLELYWFASSQRQVRSQPATIAPSLLEKSFDRDTRHPWTPPAHHRAEVKVSKEVTAVPQCANFDQQQVDAKVREMPGGTELEALEERRALSEKNWPVTSVADQLWRKRARPVVDACLRSFQHSLSSGAVSLIEQAMTICRQKVNFSCLVDATEAILHTNRATKECRDTYGAGLIEKFRRAGHAMCQGRNSEISCKQIRAHASHDIETSICTAKNFSVSFPAIDDGDFPWLKFSPGAFSLPCTVSPSARSSWHFMHSLADWMDLGLEADQEKQRCDIHVATPTYFETRSGDYSPFAVTHDWINTLILFAVENVLPDNLQIVMMDRMTVGFYTPMWQLGFSPSRQLLWFPDLREQYRGKRVCFSQGWFNIPARLSPIYNEDECTGSSLYRLYSEYLLWIVNAHRTLPPRDVLVVTLIVRRNYETGHSISRRFKNERELVAAMRSNFGAAVAVNTVDFAWFDFDQQANISRTTDVLVAMHGAGLVQMMFLPQWGGVFEFFCPEKPSSNFRYKQLAAKLSLSYESYSIENEENEVPVVEAVQRMHKLLRHVRELKSRHVWNVQRRQK